MSPRQITFQEVFWLCVINVLPKSEMFEAQSDARNVRRLSNTYFDDLLSEAQIFKNREEKKVRTTDYEYVYKWL